MGKRTGSREAARRKTAENAGKEMAMASSKTPPVDFDVVGDFLREALPFSEMEEMSRRKLARRCLIDFFPAGSRIFIRGVTEVDGLYVIQKGAVKLFMEEIESGDAKNECSPVMDYRGEGASFGALSLFRGERAALDVETVEDAFFVKIPREAFFQAVADCPAIARYYLKSFSDAFVSKAFAELRCRAPQLPGDSGLTLFSEKVGDLVARPPESVPFGATIQAAARIMVKERIGSLLVREPSGAFCGIVTDKDLRTAVALGVSAEAPVETIMSAPLETIDAHAVSFDALYAMMRRKLRHLAVTENGAVTGLVTSHDVMAMQGRSPMALFRDIAARQDIEGLYPLHARIPRMIRSLVQEGARAGNITRMIAVVSDMILTRLLELMIKQIGPPPVKFCWLAMGSEGRREQTFATDQDNALVYQDCEEDFLERAAETYFSAFTERAADHLVKCGFPLCPGGIMAKNPKWRGTVSSWKRLFDSWIDAPEPKQVMHSNIFFDFRGAFGQEGFARELRDHVSARCFGNDLFLRHMAADCLASRPPLTFFKNIVVEKDGERKNTLDLKARGLMPFMDFARVFALRVGIRETGTLARLSALRKGEHIPDDLGRDAMEAFEFLLQLRLVGQLERVERGESPDNRIDPAKLSPLEKRTLRDSFELIGSMQILLKETFRLNIA